MFNNSGLPRLRYRPGTHALDTLWGPVFDLFPGSFFITLNKKNVSKVFQVLLISKDSKIAVIAQQYNCPTYSKEKFTFSPTDRVRIYDPRVE